MQPPIKLPLLALALFSMAWVTLTRVGDGQLLPGTYAISDHEGDARVRALVTTGSAERPGAFSAVPDFPR